MRNADQLSCLILLISRLHSILAFYVNYLCHLLACFANLSFVQPFSWPIQGAPMFNWQIASCIAFFHQSSCRGFYFEILWFYGTGSGVHHPGQAKGGTGYRMNARVSGVNAILRMFGNLLMSSR